MGFHLMGMGARERQQDFSCIATGSAAHNAREPSEVLVKSKNYEQHYNGRQELHAARDPAWLLLDAEATRQEANLGKH
jgi:hypothetical protein